MSQLLEKVAAALPVSCERESEARSAAGWVPAPSQPLGGTRPAAPSQNQLGTCRIQSGGALCDWFLMGHAVSAAAPSAAAQ